MVLLISSCASEKTATHTLTVTLLNLDGASGQVTSTSAPDGPQVDCGPRCDIPLSDSTQVVLIATPAAGYYFGGWSGDCAGMSATCTLSMTQDRTAQATFTPANLLFITSTAYAVATVKSANTLSGTSSEAQKMLSGADKICRDLGGSDDFYAWIASNTENAASRLPANVRGWVRKDNQPVRDVLTRPANLYPPLLDENGADLIGDDKYFTGANDDGSPGDNCGDWLGTGKVEYGISTMTNYWSFSTTNCSTTARLLCLQAKYTATVSLPPPHADARFAFVTKMAVASNGGILTFDALCQSEAALGHLPGTYKALVATAGAPAASRFQTRNVPIYRPDGAIVTDSDAALLSASGMPEVPIAVTSTGVESTTIAAWTGADNPSAPGATDTCGGWSSANGTGSAAYIYDVTTWFSYYFLGCTETAAVYCLQQ